METDTSYQEHSPTITCTREEWRVLHILSQNERDRELMQKEWLKNVDQDTLRKCEEKGLVSCSDAACLLTVEGQSVYAAYKKEYSDE